MAVDDFGAVEPAFKIQQRRLAAAASIVQNNKIFQRVFQSPDGDKVLKDLFEKFYKSSSIVPGDPYATHAREGAREVVIYILSRIDKAEQQHGEGMDGELTG